MKPIIVACFVMCGLAAASIANAQSAAPAYPSKPVRLLVPFPPGGVADLIARPLAERLGDALGQPVVVENRAGATGTIAAGAVAAAAPDGLTLLLGTTNEIAMSPTLFKSLPYDPTTAFAAVAPVADFPNVLVVGPSLKVDSVRALLERAAASPGKLTFASSGPGSTNHLTLELFKSIAKVDVVHVPFKGGGPALTDVMGGHVDAMFATLPSAAEHIRSGRLRALAVTGARRSRTLPDVPTAAEAGVPGLVVTTWNGVLAPAGTPAPIIERLAREIRAATARADLRERYASAGAEVMNNDSAEFAALIRADFERWSQLIRQAGIRAD